MERARSEFMSVVSHELRSPLAAMYGFLNLLNQERTGPLTPMQRDCLDAAHLIVRQLWRLIVDINDLVQSDLGRLTLNKERVDIGGLIRTTVTRMTPLIEGTRMRVEMEIATSLPATQVDPVRFGQILTNLLANAIKFSEPGTVVKLSAYAAEDAVWVSVQDTGPGVLPEDTERIFERFVKGTHTPRQDASGLGLGLAVVRQLVTLHGGQVWVESTPGNGSTFFFTLPIEQPAVNSQQSVG
jgi:signal transduction histidine kinase